MRPVQAAHVMEGRVHRQYKSMACGFWEGVMDEYALLACDHLWIPGAVPEETAGFAEGDIWARLWDIPCLARQYQQPALSELYCRSAPIMTVANTDSG